MFLLQCRGGDCLRLHHLAKLTQYFRVNAIGLSQDSRRSSKLPHPVGLDQTDFDSRPRKRLDQSAFITAARFANHVHGCVDLFNPLDQLPMTNGVVTETTFLISNCCIQVRLGDIDSQVDKLLFHVINNSCF